MVKCWSPHNRWMLFLQLIPICVTMTQKWKGSLEHQLVYDHEHHGVLDLCPLDGLFNSLFRISVLKIYLLHHCQVVFNKHCSTSKLCNPCYNTWRAMWHVMMTSLNGNLSRVTGPLCGEFTGHRWIPLTKASDAQLWCFPWSAPEQTVD